MKPYSIHYGPGGRLYAREDTLGGCLDLITAGDPRSMISPIHPDDRDSIRIVERHPRYPFTVQRTFTYAQALAADPSLTTTRPRERIF